MKTISIKTLLLVFILVVASNNAFCQEDDDRMKIRMGFTSVNNIHRQLLVTVDANATAGIDFGYDAENFENHIDDMYWMIDGRKFLIQGIDNIDETTILPLGLHTDASGDSIISIEGLTNVPDDLELGLIDRETNTYYDFKLESSYSINLIAGIYLNRFELVFTNDINDDSNGDNEDSDSNDDNEEDNNNDDDNSNDSVDDDIETIDIVQDTDDDVNITISYINRIKSISIKNIGRQTIKSVRVFNIIGQQVAEYNNINAVDQTLIKTYNLNSGNYILLVTTNLGRLTKKVSVR